MLARTAIQKTVIDKHTPLGYASCVRVTFVEAPSFSAARDDYFETDEVFARFQEELARNPEVGPVLVGTHDARKMRWGQPGTGRREGLRVIYAW